MIGKKNQILPSNQLTIQVLSYDAGKIHQALLTAASAASMGRKVCLYFAKSAAQVLTQEGWGKCPAAPYASTKDMDHHFSEKGMADFDLLMTGLAGMTVDLCIAEEAVREFNLDPLTLCTKPAVNISALSTLLAHGQGGDWMTF